MKMKINTEHGYAYGIKEGLCHWAEPDMERLKDGDKPSGEAKIVPVRIVRERDWRKPSSRIESLKNDP